MEVRRSRAQKIDAPALDALAIARLSTVIFHPDSRGGGTIHRGIQMKGATAAFHFELYTRPVGIVPPRVDIQKLTLYRLDEKGRVLDKDPPLLEKKNPKSARKWDDGGTHFNAFAVKVDAKKLDPNANYIAVLELAFSGAPGPTVRTEAIGVLPDPTR